MVLEESKSRSERAQTDESLRNERANTDRALAEKLAAIEEDADMVVERARRNADAVLTTARDRADQKLTEAEAEAETQSQASDTIAKERTMEDEILQRERATADESLRREREEHASALARLLPLEREKTDRHLLTERARSDNALLNRDDFLGIVSHDLRNLLGGIVLSVAHIAAKAPDTEEGKQTVAGMKRIQRYAARMNRLIGDLGDVASIDAGKLAVLPERGDLAELVAEAVETFQPAASEKGVSLESEILGHSLAADFDPARMLQVLANLITNALKFTSSGGKIRIRGERAGGELCVCVSDTGTGIPESMLEAVFERFWQVGKNDRRGMGLGLYISKNIIESHGGRIWVESKPGEGSRFYFTLPGATGAPVPGPPPA